ncbi:type II toxin-antitoxin system Phd/YefM family antitoxin [Flavobacterium ardleyense]|uniref:type II toxin-antitoxin system Phd/YefM family antitoxin n=1 Tax=Flavobacterium ardleyense TaxID=2038737 RepID=UPI00298CB8B3|nr:type II toxin-antitoxin system Phd/YefM family antitoxin [Flavobacterium ardleyense]
MKTLKLAEFKRNTELHFEDVIKSIEPITITSKEGDGIVIISLKEYNSWMATNYEMSSRANEKRLDSAIVNMELGRTIIIDIENFR